MRRSTADATTTPAEGHGMNVLLGLGGNMGDVEAAFVTAVRALADRFAVRAASSIWRSAAVGPVQPDYLNAAIIVGVDVHPLRVMAYCHLLEARAGRDRRVETRYGPRCLDIDLLMAPDLVFEAPSLVLPHPLLALRRFALLPASEIAPAWVHPRRRATLEVLAEALSPEGQPCYAAGPFPAAALRDPAR